MCEIFWRQKKKKITYKCSRARPVHRIMMHPDYTTAPIQPLDWIYVKNQKGSEYLDFLVGSI